MITSSIRALSRPEAFPPPDNRLELSDFEHVRACNLIKLTTKKLQATPYAYQILKPEQGHGREPRPRTGRSGGGTRWGFSSI